MPGTCADRETDRTSGYDPRVRHTALGVAFFAAFLLLPGLGRMRAVDATDARYLEISREMYASGDWLVPRLAAQPHLDKPPLTYWAAALGYAALGVSPLAGRLPAQLALACTALLVALAGRRLCGRAGAAIAGLALLSSALVFTSSRGLSTDLFQLLLFSGAMLAFLRGVEGAGRPALVVLSLLLLGLSMNAKGPIALFVAALVWVPFLALTRGRTRLSWRALALGLVLFVLVGAPWYLALWARDSDVMRYFLETQLLGRVTGAVRGVHVHPPYYLFVAWPLALLPWTPLIALALWRLRPRSGWRRADATDLYLLLWSVAPVLFFSIPRTKLPTYLLVGFPAAALSVARALDQGLLADRAARRALVACAGLACGTGLLFALALLASPQIETSRLDTELIVGRLPVAAALAAASALLAHLVHRFVRRGAPLARSLVAIALGSGLVFLLGFNAIGPAVGSSSEEGLIARSVPGAWLLEAGVTRVSALYSFADVARFRFARVPSRPGIEKPPSSDWAWGDQTTADEAVALMRGDEPVFCLTEPKHVPALEAATGSVVVRRRSRTVLLANRAAQAALAAQPD
jgi:4-amino-4-deoxy-L-arabinose transferase